MFSSVDDSENEDKKPDEPARPENAVSQTTPKDSSQWVSEGMLSSTFVLTHWVIV